MEKLIKRKKSGFTLIEMIVVIAIVVIIAAIAIPQALRAVNKSRAATDIANARAYAGQLAARVANGDITTTDLTDAAGVLDADLLGMAPVAPRLEGTAFTFTYTNTNGNDNITILVDADDDQELYPTVEGTWANYNN